MAVMKNLYGTWSGEPTDTVGSVFRHCERLERWKTGQPWFIRGTRAQRKRWAMSMYRQLKGLPPIV